MSEIEEEEIAQPQQKPRGFRVRMDRVEFTLAVSGVALAAFAAFFPWYVFFHREDFGIRREGLAQNLRRNLPVGPPRPVFSVSPSASININQPSSARVGEAPRPFDDIKTATVPDDSQKAVAKEQEQDAVSQPLPSGIKGFRLLHVAGERALIEDGNGMYIVAVGAVLPDNSRLSSIRKQSGQWVIVTSNGDVIGME